MEKVSTDSLPIHSRGDSRRYFRCAAHQPTNLDVRAHTLRNGNRPREPGLYQRAEVIVFILLITGGSSGFQKIWTT